MILNTHLHAMPLQGVQPRHEAPAEPASASTAAPVQPVATTPEWAGAVAALRMAEASTSSALSLAATGADAALPDPDRPTGPPPSFQANELDVLPEKLRREIARPDAEHPAQDPGSKAAPPAHHAQAGETPLDQRL